MSTNSTSKYPNSRKLERAEVVACLTPQHLAVGLGFVKADRAPKTGYTVVCPWCRQVSLSIWRPPGAGKTAMATCKGNMGGKCGAQEPTGNKTRSPIELIATVKGWTTDGVEYQTLLLPFAAQIAGIGTTTATATTPPARSAPPPQSSASVSDAPSVSSIPAAPSPSESDEDEDVLIPVRLHPERAPMEWQYLTSIGANPYDLRHRPWLRVLPNGPAQPARIAPHLREGYTLWLTTKGPDGGSASSCAINPRTGQWRAFPVNKDALANETAEDVLADGPDDLSAWPNAERQRPPVFVVTDPKDFLLAEPEIQRRFLPLLGLTDRWLPDAILARLPTSCELRVVHTDSPTRRHHEVLQALHGSQRQASLQALASAFCPRSFCDSVPGADEIDAVIPRD